jgi:integrase
MVLDFASVSPNPARDRVQVRLPRQEASEPEPPTADSVEAVLWRLTPAYALAMLVLEATGARVGELEAATLGDLDETRQAWLVRAAVSKTQRPRWVVIPEDVFKVVVERRPAREDCVPAAQLFPDVTADRLRMAIGRACRDAGVRTSRLTRSATVGSASCTGRAPRGPTSVSGSNSDRRS